MKKEENDAEQLLNISLILNSSPLLDPFYLEDDENGDFVHRCWKFNDEYHLNIRSDRFAPEDIEQKPECRHRRNDACKRLLPDIKSRMKKWSDDPELDEILIGMNALFRFPTYDELDEESSFLLAAVLFILDELYFTGKFHLAEPLLKIHDGSFTFRMPELFYDSMHDNEAICGLGYIIMHRNDEGDEAPEENIIGPGSLKRSMQVHEYPEKDEHEINEFSSCREKFDYIISLLQPFVIESAVKRFEDKEIEVLSCFLESIAPCRRKLDSLMASMKKDFNRIKELIEEKGEKAKPNASLRNDKGAKRPDNGSGDIPAGAYLPEKTPSDRGKLSPEEELALQIVTYYKRKGDKYQELRERVMFAANLLGTSPVYDTYFDDVEDNFGPDPGPLREMRVDNPFETCFAFLYMLDSGSDYPWMEALGTAVIQKACDLLPWRDFLPFEDEDEAEDEAAEVREAGAEDVSAAEAEDAPRDDAEGVRVRDGENRGIGGLSENKEEKQAGAAEGSGTVSEKAEGDDAPEEKEDGAEKAFFENDIPFDRIEEEAKLYTPKYYFVDYSGKAKDYIVYRDNKLNFPQLIYSYTSTAIPRDVITYDEYAEEFEIIGFSEETSMILENYLMLAMAAGLKGSIRLRYPGAETADEWAEDEDSRDPGSADVNMSERTGTKQNNADGKKDKQARQTYDPALPGTDTDAAEKLKTDVRILKGKLDAVFAEKQQLRRELKQALDENAELKAELDELRNFSEIRDKIAGAQSDAPEAAAEHVQYPYEAQGRYVVFGGHDSWLKAIRPMLKNVKFVDRKTNPDKNLIRYATAVWIQSNAISHKDYYKIVDIARTAGIKYEYFSYASAEKCAEQLALYDMGMS